MLDSVSTWNDKNGSGIERGQGSFEGAKATRVPGSKEEVFKDKTASLMEKRRLMKFLMFAAGAFEEDPLLEGESGAEWYNSHRAEREYRVGVLMNQERKICL